MRLVVRGGDLNSSLEDEDLRSVTLPANPHSPYTHSISYPAKGRGNSASSDEGGHLHTIDYVAWPSPGGIWTRLRTQFRSSNPPDVLPSACPEPFNFDFCL